MKDNPLNSLKISNFMAFNSLEIDRFEQINLIIGKNSVGKSTLLEAIYLYANAGSPIIMSEIFIKRNTVNNDLSKINANIMFNFFHNSNNFEKISSNHHEFFFKIETSNGSDKNLDVIFTIPLASPGTESINDPIPEILIQFSKYPLKIQLNQTFDKIATLWEVIYKFDPYSSLIIPCNFIESSEIDGNYLSKLWNIVLIYGYKSYVIDLLHIIEPSIVDFMVIEPENAATALYLKLKDFKKAIPAKSFSDGISRLASISLALACSKDGILLIDEVDHGLHWTVLPEVWEFIFKAAKRLNVQVFATTHSSDCLRAFHYGMRSAPETQAEVVRLEREGDKFHSEIFNADRLSIITQQRIEIR